MSAGLYRKCCKEEEEQCSNNMPNVTVAIWRNP